MAAQRPRSDGVCDPGSRGRRTGRSCRRGVKISSGNVAVIAAGTGLEKECSSTSAAGWCPDNRKVATPTLPRARRGSSRWSAHSPAFGRVSAEHILSGPGLVNYRFTHDILTAEEAGLDEERVGAPAVIPVRHTCAAVGLVERSVRPSGGLRHPRSQASVRIASKQWTCSRRTVPRQATSACASSQLGCVYIGGGIAPRILPLLQHGRFIAAFRAKAPLDELVSRMPVAVILNKRSALLGAAVYANGIQRPEGPALHPSPRELSCRAGRACRSRLRTLPFVFNFTRIR